MRIAFITGDNIVRAITIEQALKARRHGDEVMFVVETELLPGKSMGEAIRFLAKKSGWRYVLYKLVETAGLSLAARLSGGRLPTLDLLSRRARAKVTPTANVNEAPTLDRIAAFKPDVIVSMGMRRLLASVVTIPTCGVINVHLGLLPDYRGLGCYIHPLLDGVENLGVTIHTIAEEQFDVGDILAQGCYRVPSEASICHLQLVNAVIGGRLLAEVLDAAEAGISAPMPQGQGRTYTLPTRKQLAELSALGRCLITPADLLQARLGAPAPPADTVMTVMVRH